MPEKDPTTWGLATWLLALGMTDQEALDRDDGFCGGNGWASLVPV